MIPANIRSYSIGPGKDVLLAIIGGFVLCLLAGIVMGPDAGPVSLLLAAAALLLGQALLRLSTNVTTIEIDSAQGLVRKMTGSLLWKKRRSYPVRDIDAVRFIEKNVIIEEGYGVTSYTIVLESGDASHELLSTNDEAQGRELYREIRSVADTFTRRMA